MAEKSIEYYKELLEVNPKWLGTQAKELLHHYSALEEKCAALSYAAYNNAEACKRLDARLSEAEMDRKILLLRCEERGEKLRRQAADITKLQTSRASLREALKEKE